jgi:tripartite-type tricarboxylate transporter receptor subunit TctC
MADCAGTSSDLQNQGDSSMNQIFSLNRRRWLAGAGAFAAAVAAPNVRAQQAHWPSKSIRFLVPFAPGGTSEIVARSVAAELTKQLGQSVYVENKPGGAGTVAMVEAAKAAPDGHTIILGHVGTLAVNPYMLSNQPYDVNKDFVPVTLLAKVPNVFVIHPEVPAKDFKEFVAYVKANPGKLNYGSAGNASAGHLAMEYLKLVTGMYITHIPYRGTGPQLTDLLAGRTQASSAGMPALGAHIRAGKLRAVAVGTLQRIGAMPDVPTVAEMGYRDFETSQWYGILAPAGTPADVVRKLQEESLKALRSSAVTERFANDSAVGGGGPPSDFAAFIGREQKIWKDIVHKAHIKAD